MSIVSRPNVEMGGATGLKLEEHEVCRRVGGVLSGLGKGVTASSIGVLLKSAGLRVTAIKIDPYLNSDAGTVSIRTWRSLCFG